MINTYPTIYNPKVRAGTISGPASYATGGFTFTPGGFNKITFCRLSVVAEGTILTAKFSLTYNSPAAGQVNVKVLREQYDKISTIINAITPPSSVTIATSNNQTVSSTAHTHTTTHNHAVTAASGTPSTGTGAVLVDAVSGTNQSAHTHTVDPSNFGPGSSSNSHSHISNTLYQHQHGTGAQTTPLTTLSAPEVANTTNLSTSTWSYLVIGV